VGSTGGSAVLVGLDSVAALRELETRSPLPRSAEQAAQRARTLDLRPTGAAEKIVAALTAGGAAR
jgi:hypothetical protein